MSLVPLPVIVTNLGVEMTYILKQRLEAQKIGDDKAARVINDVLRTLFTPALMEELRKPQDLYTIPSIRLLFDRIVHSSIMRLSDQSMDKLYDLIVMGLKYQVLSCKTPEELVTVTETHIQTATQMCTDDLTAHMITHACKSILTSVTGLTPGQWIELRHRVMAFVQNKRVKVSLFLQEGLQSNDGRFNLPAPSPTNARGLPMGTVRFVDPAGRVLEEQRLRVDPCILEPEYYLVHPEPPGANLYRSGREKVTRVPRAWRGQPPHSPAPPPKEQPGDVAASAPAAAGPVASPSGAPAAPADPPPPPPAPAIVANAASYDSAAVFSLSSLAGTSGSMGIFGRAPGDAGLSEGGAAGPASPGAGTDNRAAIERMKHLATFIGAGQGPSGAGDFKLNLFNAANVFDTEDVSSQDHQVEEQHVRTIIVDSEKQRQTYKEEKLASVLKAMDFGPSKAAAKAAPPPAEEDEDDLLALMDGL